MAIGQGKKGKKARRSQLKDTKVFSRIRRRQELQVPTQSTRPCLGIEDEVPVLGETVCVCVCVCVCVYVCVGEHRQGLTRKTDKKYLHVFPVNET